MAPASPFDRTLALRGIAWLGERYRVLWDWALFARQGFLAGSDRRRADELDRAVRSGARAIVAARGGYGLLRIADRLDWDGWAERCPWLVGFSDCTVLHVEAARHKLATVHGPMVCALGRGDAVTRARWIETLEAPLERRKWTGLRCWAPGRASGPMFGGNLTLLHACAAAGTLAVPEGAILLIEDVTERPYRVDRMLTSLALGGHLRSVHGVVVGDFTQCDPGPDGVTVEQVLRDRLTELGVPIACGLPFGHERRNDPVVLGAPAELDAQAGTLVVGGRH